jgi:hypothetical protein
MAYFAYATWHIRPGWRLISGLGHQQTHLDSANGSLGAVGDVQLPDYPLDVNLDGPLADYQCLGDLLIGPPGRQKSQDL